MSNKINQRSTTNLKLLNSSIIPKFNTCIFSSKENNLIYSISSNIFIHNIKNDSKRIINIKDKNKIIKMKYLDEDKNYLLTISKNKFPKINILSLNLNEKNIITTYIYSKAIPIESNFFPSNIFIDRFRYNLFLIILTSIDKNILYFFHLTNINRNVYDIIPFGKLQNLELEIIDFKCFYNDSLIICITRNSIIYYKLDLEKKICQFCNNIKFKFKILPSLQIDRKNNLISVLSSSGECLIYDKEGNNISNIKCPVHKENFVFFLFSNFNNSLCLSTNNGNIFIYKIDYYNNTYVLKVKNYIKYSFINKIIKKKYEYNHSLNNIYKNINPDNNKNNKSEIIFYNEKNDLIIFTLNNGDGLIRASLSALISKNINEDTIFKYEFNHSELINNGNIIYNANASLDNSYDNIIYSCSRDNILNQKYYKYSSNKFFNYYFNFKYLFKEPNIFITSIRFHPKYGQDILYAGDNKGCLYIIYKDKNYQYQKYYLNKNINFSETPIISIKFSSESDYIIYIGFNNGIQRLYDLGVDKNFNYYKLLSNTFLEKNEIDYRTKKNHVIVFCYFFIFKYNFKKCFLYLNNQNMIKISKIDNENIITSNNYNNEILLIKYDKKILDLKMHKSEDYIIVLNNQRQIIINELNYGNIVSKIDLNEIMNYIYNIEIDISGLYLSIICDFKNSILNNNKSSIAIMEINTGKIQNYLKEANFPIIKTKFDYYGRFLITFGEKGEISIWEFDKKIKNDIINAIIEIKKDFYYFWEKYKIKNFNDNTEIDINNNDIINEILEDENQNINEKESNYLNLDSYINPEDFFRINNHGEKSINFNISKSLNNKYNPDDNSKSSIKNSIDKNNKYSNNISQMSSNINNLGINKSDYNRNNDDEDNFINEDHYINRKKNNYKNSFNYIQTFTNINRENYKKNYEDQKEKKTAINSSYKEKNNGKKRSISSNNNKNIIINNNKNLDKSSKNNIKSKSLRDIILKGDEANPKIINIKKEINKNGNDIIHNNNYIETPHFLLSPKSVNSNIYKENINNIKNSLNLLSLTLPKQYLNSNRDNFKDIFDLKKKIIVESSSLMHNERRMMNLANALNKLTIRNTASNNQNSINKEENDKSNTITKSNISKNSSKISTNRKNRYLNFDKKIMFGDNEEYFKGKYPEPDDIDMNLVNVNNESNKNNNSNIIRINKNDDSNENLYFINNNRENSNINNNNNYYNKSTSISVIKEIQNNNNSSIDKNYINNNSYIVQEITNFDNTSIGDQISYLENNINKFEKNFGNN